MRCQIQGYNCHWPDPGLQLPLAGSRVTTAIGRIQGYNCHWLDPRLPLPLAGSRVTTAICNDYIDTVYIYYILGERELDPELALKIVNNHPAQPAISHPTSEPGNQPGNQPATHLATTLALSPVTWLSPPHSGRPPPMIAGPLPRTHLATHTVSVPAGPLPPTQASPPRNAEPLLAWLPPLATAGARL